MDNKIDQLVEEKQIPKPSSFASFAATCLVICLVLAFLCALATGSISNDSGLFAGSFFSSLLFFLLLLGGTGTYIWTLVDCLKNESSQGNEKIVWFLVIFFLWIFGAILYMAIRRPQRIAELGH